MSNDTEKQERVESISSSYNQRVKALEEARTVGARNDADAEVAAAEARLEAAKAKREALDSDEDPGDATPEPVDELPDMSWKKDDILDYLVRVGAVENREDVEDQTKAELLDNFVDDEG